MQEIFIGYCLSAQAECWQLCYSVDRAQWIFYSEGRLSRQPRWELECCRHYLGGCFVFQIATVRRQKTQKTCTKVSLTQTWILGTGDLWEPEKILCGSCNVVIVATVWTDGLGLAEERRDKTSEGILLDWLVPNSRKEVVVLGTGHKIRKEKWSIRIIVKPFYYRDEWEELKVVSGVCLPGASG